MGVAPLAQSDIAAVGSWDRVGLQRAPNDRLHHADGRAARRRAPRERCPRCREAAPALGAGAQRPGQREHVCYSLLVGRLSPPWPAWQGHRPARFTLDDWEANPVPVQGPSAHARVSDHAGLVWTRVSAPTYVAFRVCDRVGAQN